MRFIAFFDILGFKDLVNSNTHDQLKELYDHFTKAASLSLANFQSQHGNLSKNTIKSVDMSKTTLNSLIVSDSVIIWSDNSSPLEFIELMHACQLMLIAGFQIGVPVRGGVSFGNFTFQDQIITSPKQNKLTSCFGKGLVDAYTLESYQEWSGCIVDSLAINFFNEEVKKVQALSNEDFVDLEYLIEMKLLVNYNAPLKNKIENYLVVNYLNYSDMDMGFSEEKILSSFTAYNKNISEPSVQKKIKNTLAFFNFAKNNNLIGEHK